MTRSLFTVGHSSHALGHFLALLKKHRVTAISDVRSVPYSRRNPQFNREPLSAELRENGIAYVFLGKELGARSDDPSCYVDDKARYERIASTVPFKKGLERILKGLETHRIALMCAEADPLTCHRMILVCRNLRRPELDIAHILPSGDLEKHEDSERRLLRITGLAQEDLFEDAADPIERAYDLQGEKIAYVKAPEPIPPSPEFGRP